MRDIAGQTIELGPFGSTVVVPVLDREGQPRLREATPSALRRQGADSVIGCLLNDDETFTERHFMAEDCAVLDEDLELNDMIAVPSIDPSDGEPTLRIGKIQTLIHTHPSVTVEYVIMGDRDGEVHSIDSADVVPIEIIRDEYACCC